MPQITPCGRQRLGPAARFGPGAGLWIKRCFRPNALTSVGGKGAVMSTTLNDVSPKKQPHDDRSAEAAAAAELVRLAKEQGLALTGPDGLLKLFPKNVLETALNEELTEHLGHEKNRVAPDRDNANVRNGTRAKTVLTEATGQVTIDVPRDRDGSLEPQIVKKRQRRLNGVEEIVLSLYAHGLTTGEISAHFAQIYGASSARRRSRASPTK